MTDDLADRIRSIANLVDRSGVYEMLHDIADELDGEDVEPVMPKPKVIGRLVADPTFTPKASA